METKDEVGHWVHSCLRKKKLKYEWANSVIKRAEQEGTKLYKYRCRSCFAWHITKRSQGDSRDRER